MPKLLSNWSQKWFSMFCCLTWLYLPPVLFEAEKWILFLNSQKDVSVFKVIYFLNIYNPTVISNDPQLGTWRFLLPKAVYHKQTPEKWKVCLSYGVWGEDDYENGKREMTRRNQLDIRCSEIDTFFFFLIECNHKAILFAWSDSLGGLIPSLPLDTISGRPRVFSTCL